MPFSHLSGANVGRAAESLGNGVVHESADLREMLGVVGAPQLEETLEGDGARSFQASRAQPLRGLERAESMDDLSPNSRHLVDHFFMRTLVVAALLGETSAIDARKGGIGLGEDARQARQETLHVDIPNMVDVLAK